MALVLLNVGTPLWSSSCCCSSSTSAKSVSCLPVLLHLPLLPIPISSYSQLSLFFTVGLLSDACFLLRGLFNLSVPRLCMKPVSLQSVRLEGLSSSLPIVSARNVGVITRAASETPDGVEASTDGGKEESVTIDKLPLESKLQLRVEQQEKMKLARKIRLRRKRLVRKRKLRKKGRWPPSKMSKLKNV